MCYLWLYRQDQEGQANTVSGRGVQICHIKNDWNDTVLLPVNPNCKSAADTVQVNTQTHGNLSFFLWDNKMWGVFSLQNSEPQGNTNIFLLCETPSTAQFKLLLLGGRRANFWAGIDFYSKCTMTSLSKLVSSFPKLNLPGSVLKILFLASEFALSWNTVVHNKHQASRGCFTANCRQLNVSCVYS